jgi:hypothetical protein
MNLNLLDQTCGCNITSKKLFEEKCQTASSSGLFCPHWPPRRSAEHNGSAVIQDFNSQSYLQTLSLDVIHYFHDSLLSISINQYQRPLQQRHLHHVQLIAQKNKFSGRWIIRLYPKAAAKTQLRRFD